MHPIRSPWSNAGLINNKDNKKPIYTWKINNALLSDCMVKEDIKKEIKNFPEFIENENTTYPNL